MNIYKYNTKNCLLIKFKRVIYSSHVANSLMTQSPCPRINMLMAPHLPIWFTDAYGGVPPAVPVHALCYANVKTVITSTNVNVNTSLGNYWNPGIMALKNGIYSS